MSDYSKPTSPGTHLVCRKTGSGHIGYSHWDECGICAGWMSSDELRANLKIAREALLKYSSRGCHDTCQRALDDVYSCACGYAEAVIALKETE